MKTDLINGNRPAIPQLLEEEIERQERLGQRGICATNKAARIVGESLFPPMNARKVLEFVAGWNEPGAEEERSSKVDKFQLEFVDDVTPTRTRTLPERGNSAWLREQLGDMVPGQTKSIVSDDKRFLNRIQTHISHFSKGATRRGVWRSNEGKAAYWTTLKSWEQDKSLAEGTYKLSVTLNPR